MESKTTRVGLLLLFFASLILVIAVPGDALHNNDSDSASELVPLYLGEVDTVDYYFDHDDFGTSIGIDLVYSHSCVGVARNGRIEIIPNDLGNTKTPNWISFTDNQTLIGEAAKNQATFYPQATIFNVKPLLTRMFGDPEVQRKIKISPNKVVNNEGKPYIEVKVRGETKTFSPEEITAMFLGKIKDMAENYIRKRVRIAILIVPDYFNYEQRSAVKKAAVLAGFNQAQVINHAVAAFYAHNLHNRKGESNFLLFHLSGDRCDVTIVDHENGVFEILARRGDIQLGGQEFNQRVVNHFISLIKSKYGRDISKDTSALEKLLNECERATIALSSQEQVMVEVESLFDGFNFSEPLTRTRFEELNQGLFEKMMALAEKALEEAGLKKVDIHDILLVGGSAKIPKVQKLLKDFFDGKEPNKAADHVNPNEVLVRGALVFGGSWNEYGFYLGEVLPVSVGIETVGGVMTKVIRRNNIVPVKNVKKIFTTNQDNQSTIEIKVYNGERRVVKDCRELGRFNLTGILPAPRGTPQVEITFDIDENYILHAKAEDKASKTSASKTFFGVIYGYDSGEELIRMSEIVEEEDRMYWLEKSQNLLKNTQEPNNNNAAIE